MKKTPIIITAIVLSISCTTQNTDSNNYAKVEVLAFLKGLETAEEKVILVDVRTPKEFKSVKINDAININYYDANFKEQVNLLDTTKTAYIYCKSGGRSDKAAKVFIATGFNKVIDLKGGLNAYLKR
jgi:rhodanese-related sulfurtransferase